MEHPLPEMGDTFVLRVQLRGIEPAIWRRLSLPADAPLGVLHEVIQVAFGWQNSHLHEFLFGQIRFGPDDGESELLVVDEFAAPLGAVARVGATFLYRYDFGDDWEHDVVVENVSADGEDGLACMGGARSGPPEDCGGPPGYENLIAILANPSHAEHRDMKTWVGRGFDPEKFDVTATNKKLAALWKRLSRGG